MDFTLIWHVIGLLLGAGIGFGVRHYVGIRRVNSIEQRARGIEEDAKRKAEELILKAKKRGVDILGEVRQEEKELRKRFTNNEERLNRRETELQRLAKRTEAYQSEIEQERVALQAMRKETEDLKELELTQLESISRLSQNQAKEQLFKEVEERYWKDLYNRVKALEEEGEKTLEEKAKNIMALAMQRLASVHTSEVVSYTMDIPSDEVKGKIIGKEGRNIRAFERATGVELVIDETPGVVTLSSFNPIRREIARLALERLVRDGRIQPARIEQEVEKAKQDVGQEIVDAGKDAVYQLGIVGLNPDLIKIVGRLKFRTSYGQNVLEHSMETARLGEIMATELGIDVAVTKKAGLLHDIGKAVDREVQGTHVEIGKRILEKYGVDESVIKAMQSHHGEYEPETIEALIVEAADAISASRPGARKGSLEEFLQRLEELEAITNSFEGVQKSYAIQAGREVRIFVNPESVDDVGAQKLARDVAEKIEEKLKYPGEIKIIVIRENRVIEYAR